MHRVAVLRSLGSYQTSVKNWYRDYLKTFSSDIDLAFEYALCPFEYVVLAEELNAIYNEDLWV